jgi:hypothetical protein
MHRTDFKVGLDQRDLAAWIRQQSRAQLLEVVKRSRNDGALLEQVLRRGDAGVGCFHQTRRGAATDFDKAVLHLA